MALYSEVRVCNSLRPTKTKCNYVYVFGLDTNCIKSGTDYVRLLSPNNDLSTRIDFLVDYKIPPTFKCRDDGEVPLCIVGHKVLESLLRLNRPLEALSIFDIARFAVLFRFRPRIRVIQLTAKMQRPDPVVDTTALGVIIPHKGSGRRLKNCLSSISDPHKSNTYVGFDERKQHYHRTVAAEHKSTKFFECAPSGRGPYSLRNALTERAKCQFIAFQDSDDIPCFDRFFTLEAELKNYPNQVIGSHILSLDLINRKFRILRFPLSPGSFGNFIPSYSMHFPATAMSKSKFLAVGALCGSRTHSLDSQFLWRAAFNAQMRNLDDFLYIQVKRQRSLTTSSRTGFGSTERSNLSNAWKRDTIRIQRGELKIQNSSLWPVERADPKLVEISTRSDGFVAKA